MWLFPNALLLVVRERCAAHTLYEDEDVLEPELMDELEWCDEVGDGLGGNRPPD